MSGPTDYSEKVMDHFMHPRNVGEIPDADGIGKVGNPICGDIMALYIKVDDNIISDAKFKTFGCLPANEEVVSSKGGWERISLVNVGDPVVNSKGEEANVVETYKRDYIGDILTITPFVSPYNRFSLTTDHPVLTVRRRDLKRSRVYGPKCDWFKVDHEELLNIRPYFIKAANLEKGDYLVYRFNKKVVDNPLFTIDKMRLIGYYLSEGYICAGGSVVAFAFNKKEREFIDDVKGLINKIVGKEAKERTRGNVSEVYVCSRKLARFLYSAGNKLARNKSISEEILLLPFEKQWEMVKTYIAGDGDKYRRRPKDSETYRISTVSKNLAIQIQEILARGGIFASIREQNIAVHLIEGRKIGPSKKFVISFKLQRIHKFVHSGEGYFLVPIRKIERRYFEGPVYNFQVSIEPNTYLVKGFAVHNCGAAISTSSMVTELVKGKTIDEAMKISNKAVAEALGGLPPIKMHCSLLAEQALKAALEDYFKKKGMPLPWPKKEMKEHEHEIFE